VKQRRRRERGGGREGPEKYLGKIPDDMTSLLVFFSQNIKQKGLHVIIQGFMVKK